jgi:crotonobetainyl-CoA:carnitine CoA-transferase CaiB-like acyl-CoA transferase
MHYNTREGHHDAARPALTPQLLDGLTVLDFTRVLAGPYCTRLLADLGARVIKIERPGEGDEMRRGFLQLDPERVDQSTYFIRINAGKRSVAVDLAHADARPLVFDLVRQADVVVENFLPGVMAKLGLDYAAVSAVHPGVVYCSISGYGQSGPLSHAPAFALLINAISGLMHLEQGDDPAPRPGYLQAADVLAGTHAFGAILAALVRRGRTGQGARLDVSMLEALVAAEDISYGGVLNGGAEMPGPRPGMIVHRIGERYLAVQTVGAPQLWARVTRMIGRPDLVSDPRFATPAARRERWDEIRQLVTRWLDGFESVDAAVEALRAARVPCAPVLSPAEVAAHPHMRARHAFPAVPHPTRGEVHITATPFHVDHAAVKPAGGAPYRVGEHTHAVLHDVLGYPKERIEALTARGVIEQA